MLQAEDPQPVPHEGDVVDALCGRISDGHLPDGGRQGGAQGRGLGEALVRRLLSGRDENNVLLSTPEMNGEANRAWRLYRRLGFTDIIRGYHFAGDPRAFAILGRTLPL